MNGLTQFLASMNGRIIRIVAGVVLIVVGWQVGDTAGWIIGLIGLVPLLAGIFDFCVMSRLMGHPFWGRDIRRDIRRGTR